MPPSVPATAALRSLLAHAGEEHSEPALFVLAGGIGAGVFAFLYEKEDSASLFLAGRHLWADDHGYLTAACKRLGWKAVTKETTSAKTAEQELRKALERGAPIIAWVDMAHLPYRAMPAHYSGGGYHVLTVHGIRGDSVVISDLGAPLELSLRDLAAARGRIAKFRNRLLWLDGRVGRPPAPEAVLADALKTCVTTLAKAKMANFRLDAFQELAERMTARTGRESWEVMFPRGHRLWTALTSLYQYVEHYGTGGGLCRAIFAEGLAELGRADDAARYAALAARWSEVARLALPEEVAPCREARELIAVRSALVGAQAPAAEIRACWERLAKLDREARKKFPLDAAGVAALRAALAARIGEIHAAEVAALEALGRR